MYDESEPEPLTEMDSPNKTDFIAGDADTGRRLDNSESHENWYSRLARYNNDVKVGQQPNNKLRRHQDDLAIYDSVVGCLELTPYQKRRGRQQFSELPFEDWTNQVFDVPLMAFCVAAHVVRDDGRMYHPNRSDENNDELFMDFVIDRDYQIRVVRKCYGKVRHRLDNDKNEPKLTSMD